MPIFDFTCKECGKHFDLLISSADKNKVKCPECQSSKIKQLLSSFNSTKSGVPNNNCSTCNVRSSGG